MRNPPSKKRNLRVLHFEVVMASYRYQCMCLSKRICSVFFLDNRGESYCNPSFRRRCLEARTRLLDEMISRLRDSLDCTCFNCSISECKVVFFAARAPYSPLCTLTPGKICKDYPGVYLASLNIAYL